MVGAGSVLTHPSKAKQDVQPMAHTGQDPVFMQAGDVELSSELVVNGLARPVQVCPSQATMIASLLSSNAPVAQDEFAFSILTQVK